MKNTAVLLLCILLGAAGCHGRVPTEPPQVEDHQVEPRFVIENDKHSMTHSDLFNSDGYTIAISGVKSLGRDLPEGTEIVVEVYDRNSKSWEAASCRFNVTGAYTVGRHPGNPSWSYCYEKDSDWGRMTAAGPYPFINRVRAWVVMPDGRIVGGTGGAEYAPPPRPVRRKVRVNSIPIPLVPLDDGAGS